MDALWDCLDGTPYRWSIAGWMVVIIALTGFAKAYSFREPLSVLKLLRQLPNGIP